MPLLSKKYIKSLVYGFRYRRTFKSVKNFCFFIGHARSGHSFIGALLDAHPEAIMGMEIHALKLVSQGYSKNQIYYIILNNSRKFRSALNNVWTGYSYAVPNQYQGRYKTIKVIGDKRGGSTSVMFRNDFSIYEKLQSLVKCQVKILHVIRNPFDNISTMVTRNLMEGAEPTHKDVLFKINQYFDKVRIVANVKEGLDLEILDIHHEDFVTKPEIELRKILAFFVFHPYDDYINDCSSVVYKEPHKSRHKFKWSDDLINQVNSLINEYPHLKRYSFDD